MYAGNGDISQHCRLRTPPSSEGQIEEQDKLGDRIQCQQSRITYRMCVVKIEISSLDKGREGLGKRLVVIKGRL